MASCPRASRRGRAKPATFSSDCKFAAQAEAAGGRAAADSWSCVATVLRLPQRPRVTGIVGNCGQASARAEVGLASWRAPTHGEGAHGALGHRPGGLSPLNVGVALAGNEARRMPRARLIRSGNQVLSTLARHGLIAKLQPRQISWPIFKLTQEGRSALRD
jgi:hypothetical protein